MYVSFIAHAFIVTFRDVREKWSFCWNMGSGEVPFKHNMQSTVSQQCKFSVKMFAICLFTWKTATLQEMYTAYYKLLVVEWLFSIPKYLQ